MRCGVKSCMMARMAQCDMNCLDLCCCVFVPRYARERKARAVKQRTTPACICTCSCHRGFAGMPLLDGRFRYTALGGCEHSVLAALGFPPLSGPALPASALRRRGKGEFHAQCVGTPGIRSQRLQRGPPTRAGLACLGRYLRYNCINIIRVRFGGPGNLDIL